MSRNGYLRPLALAGVEHTFVPYADFLKNTQFYSQQQCLIVPVPSAWRFDLPGRMNFISAFVCESNTIPFSDAEKLRKMKSIWVPSFFCKKVLSNNGFESSVIPYSMEMPKRMRSVDQSRFTFMCSFDGKFTIHRKGVYQAIEAFRSAFTTEDVCLKIKTFEMSDVKMKQLKQIIGNDKRISIVNKYVDTTDDIYDDIDCYVSLHASEGFGRHLAEALMRQVPVICTNYGGNTDFCFNESSFLVGGSFVNHNLDPQYSWNGVWIEPDINLAAIQMQRVYNDYGEALSRATVGQRLVCRMYSDETIATTIKTVL